MSPMIMETVQTRKAIFPATPAMPPIENNTRAGTPLATQNAPFQSIARTSLLDEASSAPSAVSVVCPVAIVVSLPVLFSIISSRVILRFFVADPSTYVRPRPSAARSAAARGLHCGFELVNQSKPLHTTKAQARSSYDFHFHPQP